MSTAGRSDHKSNTPGLVSCNHRDVRNSDVWLVNVLERWASAGDGVPCRQ